MSLPDENHVIELLKQVRQESAPPRQVWKQMGKERLIREASRMQQTVKVKRVVAGAGSLAATVFMGVWLSVDPPLLKPLLDTQSTISPPAQITATPPLVTPTPSVENEAKPQQEQNPAEKKAVQNQTVTRDAHKPQSQSVQQTPKREKTPVEVQAEAYLQKKLGTQSQWFEVDHAHSNLAQGEVAFRKIINGIPLQENSVTVRISQETGEISLLLYPEREKSVITPPPVNRDQTTDKAKAAEQLASTLRLVYTGKTNPTLKYVADSNVYVDATTGDLINQSSAEKKSVAVTGEGKALTMKTSEDVVEMLNSMMGIKLEKKAFIQVNEKGMSYSWNDGQGRAVSVETTDAGEFLGFSQVDADAPKRTITDEEAQATAIDHLEKFLPADIRELSIEAIHKSSSTIQFTFAPKQNGIPVIDHSYMVTVELASGLLTELTGDFANTSWTKSNLPANMLSKEEAHIRFVKSVPLELVYLPAENGVTPILAYQIQRESSQSWEMEATTGKVVH